ncbi:SusC/RagA family TonB-linked outer membrane protein [Dinghuibacter silviterrae]|uniref:TonB-linked SusC/RagA family outer membrane protein n=1 Tax=Dinghuibacter silviterrae TaxID=1539049 RepID=A0A4R8DE76_9BACT|nr:SusC/RagA family TonB-linked outer membrane protein [Dinghuibacter silviterrae]TDW95715.1 TonB-linked SusC/RagA family outer membrane protein [Dinghuibacter silviterrae]
MRKTLLLGALLLCSLWTFAQTRLLQGRVTDDQGQPAAFASVQLKRNHKGVAADADGRFSISVKAGDVLVISGTNITSKEITVGDEPSLNIVISHKSTTMTEVVVTALGQTQAKAKIGYATQTFNTAAINKNGVTGALDGLEGKIAGAEISNTGGPGSSTKVVLRSYGVISGGDNQPLYVVDGVPMSDAIFSGNTTGTDGADYGNGMNNINPNDIETITVLKGTAASSLYGSLAKNGAIMITTKRGRAGKLKVEYSGSFNMSQAGKLPTYQDEFGQGWGGVMVLDENGSWGPKYDGTIRPWGSIVNGKQLSKPFVAIKNPLRQFYVTGHEYNNNLALSGGSDANRFYFSYGNVSSDGIVPINGNTQQRNTLSFRTNSRYGNFTFNTSINYVGQILKVPNTGQGTSSGGGVYESVLQIPVDIPIKQFKDINNPFFNINNFFTPYAENPYFGLYNNGNQQKLDRIFGNLDFGYKFTPQLSAEFRLGADITNARTFEWKNSANALAGTWDGFPATNPEGIFAIRNPDYGGVAQGSDYYGLVNGDLILKYNADLGSGFSLDALAGGNYYTTSQRSELASITPIAVPGFYNLNNTGKPPTVTDQSGQYRKIGVYGQVTLGYKDQLYLTGNVRNDWSSALPINANSIFYPGADLSWVASSLFANSSTVSYLKFRAAYGKTGSDPAPYQTLAQLGTGNITLPFGSLTVPFNGVSGFGVSDQINNANLKPIFTNEWEGGVEARFLKDRIGLDATVYSKKTKGQIFAVPVAPSSGYATYVQNLGTIGNKGIELTLNVRPVETRNFTWNLTYVFSRDWNKVLELTGSSQDPLLFGFSSAVDAEMRAVVGKTVASIYTGIPQTNAAGQVVVNPVTGYPLPNTTGLYGLNLTKGYMGSGLYTYQMGLTNTFTYKNWTLSGSLDFRYGGVMYSGTANLSLFVGNAAPTVYNDRRPFIFPNSVISVGGGKYVPNTVFIGSPGGGGESDQYYNAYSESNSFSGAADQQRIIDKSFLKLRDVNLSYNLPGSWAAKIKASTASLGVYGRNFLLWTPKNNVYVDPEATDLGNDLQSEYGELTGPPLTKSYGVIVKIVF